MILGYVAELKLHQLWLERPEISNVVKPDDHDRRRKGDRVVYYRGASFVIESKSLQTSTVRQFEDGWIGRAQVDASDRRSVKLPDGSAVSTTCLRRGEFDILAVNVFEFTKQWRFAFAKNVDLPTSTYRGYSTYQREHLLATMVTVHWPPKPPFRDEPFTLMDEILARKPDCQIGVDDFDVGQVLPISADFVLTFNDENTFVLQHPPSFAAAFNIEVHHRGMPFSAALAWFLVAVRIVVPKCRVRTRSCFGGAASAEKPFHVGWIKYYDIQRATFVWQDATVNARGEIRRVEVVARGVHLAPEDAFAIGDISDLGTLFHMQLEYMRKDVGIGADMSGQHQFR